MHVGTGFFFQGLSDPIDANVYGIQMPLVDRAEKLGFESIWTAEHHFTRYHMMPNPAQFLTWVAARTEKALVGSMVMIIPWHDPIRVAEEIALLDTLSDGRVVFGVGRGLGAVEFDGFRLEMGESRQRFVEYAAAISDSLETGILKADGPLHKQPPVEIRPRPAYTFRGRSYASAVSPESAKIMARFGYGLMLIAQKPWETVVKETRDYAELFESINGYPAPRPILVNLTTVDKDPGRARAMHDEYTMAYARTTIEHYEFDNPRMEQVNGYEYYAGLRKNIEKHGVEKFNRFLADLQISGTPDQVLDATVDRVRALDCAAVINILTMGGMSSEVATRNFMTYAQEVLPRLKQIDTFRTIGLNAGADNSTAPLSVAIGG
ncbi:alkanal monooxygenase [Pusillimonas sp. T7-7]|uniref:LLM class flavin-dependent oxidoreductase n=1 Tax=Pusillimonas sp. (strain T7-7) TaxID=1007105 RepID=UPI0002084F5B|nr:LLM class flavin-dependent oxidoreductase [Pusillimonas sp. T7-7]AEC21215.1 alkanal monooxygenase [Pusillimonas sp. T7-7]